MPFFEDIKVRLPPNASREEVEFVVALMVYEHAVADEVVQQRPWTFARVKVCFNGVAFEGVGFARQREYSSLVAYSIKEFPWVRVVWARKDAWKPDVGTFYAMTRAVNNVVRNVTKAYCRWQSGKLWVKPKEGDD